MGAPQLNIKDAAITAMVRELAELTGESRTEAVRKAVQQRLQREKDRQAELEPQRPRPRLTPAQQRRLKATWEKVRKIQAAVTQSQIDNMLSDDDLYDERGFPK
jgi:hypothetical protein